MNSVLVFENVTVSRRGRNILSDISFTIKEDESVSLLGPNGSGKTTLIRSMCGLEKLTKGSVRFFGEPFHSRVRKSIGYVPQHMHIDSRFPISVSDVVSIGQCQTKHSKKEQKKIVNETLSLVGITHLAERPIGHISGGEKHKVLIARALAQNPRIILLDEPVSNLDIQSQEEIISLLDRVTEERKCTMVFVTHIPDHIPGSCKRTLNLKDGKLKEEDQRTKD